MSKAQGMPINVIIVAAISLIVLVVLVAIFTGRIGGLNKGIDDLKRYCAAAPAGTDQRQLLNGRINPIDDSCPDGFHEAIGKFEDLSSGEKCCIEN